MLGTKCGWLVKRNEQHVWQKRWCCVVPHTFLYYFEASPAQTKTNNNNADESDDNIQTHEVWSGGGVNINIFTNLDQDALNNAVKEGLVDDVGGGGTGSSSKTMSLYSSLPNIMGGGGNNTSTSTELLNESIMMTDPESTAVNNPISPTAGDVGDGNSKSYQFVSTNLQPVGIIDLECYSAVNRSKLNPTVLELAGDSVTNPDLRSFYFQSPTIEDAESWTKALLSDRHQSLKDETEAYRQVCESFPLQLSNCSQMIDVAEAKAEAMEREAYSVRSASEEGRRKVVSAVREMLERTCWETKERKRKDSPFGGDDALTTAKGCKKKKEDISSSKEEKDALLNAVLDQHFDKLETNRTAFLRELEATLSSPSAVATSNVVPPVQTLVDYTAAIIGSFSDLRTQLQKVEMDLSTSVKQDQSQLETLKGAIEGRDTQLADAEKKYSRITSDLKSELNASRQDVEELTKQMEAQRMELSMYQNSTKTKLSELGQHKKILKREVIELRKKIDESGSENTAVAHEYENIKSAYQSMKDKNTTLERYIKSLEKQVGVQQNMMEMMSQTGGASIVGKIVGPDANQNDSNDAISLSGISMGSQLRRMNISEGITSKDAKSHTPSYKHRPLLPPDSSKGRNIQSSISPLPTPKFNNSGGQEKGGVVKSLDQIVNDAVPGEDDRDPSTVYASDSPSSTNINSNDVDSPPKSTSRRSSSNTDDDRYDIGNTPSNDPITSNRSAESAEYLSPKSPDGKDEGEHLPTVDKDTPTQSNASDSRFVVEEDEVVQSPTLDTNAEMTLNVNASAEEQVKVVALNDQFLSEAADESNNLDDNDDDDDNVSRVSDITEDRTQRQIDDDLAERRKILLAYVNKTNGGSVSLSNASTQRRLETIENMLPSTREDLESNSESRGSSTRLSVAQRARLDAESGSNSHRSLSPIPATRVRCDSSVSSGQGSTSDTVGRSGSFLKSIGKAIERKLDNSVLGVNLTDDDDYYDTESEVNTSVVSEASTTLQERIAKQRERQVAFLKNKGLIDDEKSMKGGAGAASLSPRRSSPLSVSAARTPRFSSTKSSSSLSSRRWSPGDTQDEV